MSTAHDRAPTGDDHSGWDELAVGWALHALEPEDETRFTDHLSGCTRCARTVAETTEVMAAMAGDLPQAEPSEALRDRLRAAVEQTEQLPPTPVAAEPPAPPRPGRQPPPARAAAEATADLRPPPPALDVDPRPAWRRLLPTALVAAVVAAVLSLGAWNVVLTSDRDAARATAAEQSQLLEALLAPGRAAIAPLTDEGREVATVVARGDRVQVVAEGLPVNDTGNSTYVVWGMDDGTPVALGTFDVVTPQMDLRTVGSSATGLDRYSAYAISIEPGREAPSTPTVVVANGEVDS
jgi:anti-sigma-K factor RskA